MANDYIKLEYWDVCDVGCHYVNGWKQWMYIDSDLIISEPFITENGSEDQYNEFKATFKKYSDKYEIEVPTAPEYVIDALSAMQLCKYVTVVRKTGEVANVRNISINVDWKFNDCYALVKMSFEVDKFIYKSCCGVECEECTPTIDEYTIGAGNVLLKGVGCGGFIQVQELVGGVWVELIMIGFAPFLRRGVMMLRIS